MKLRSLIIDDEPKSSRLLHAYLSEFSEVDVVGIGFNAGEAYSLINKHNPDLVFLDISMPGENAFDLLKKFASRSFEVVFITAYGQYALRAFEENALQYLLKPIDIERLQGTVNRCIKLLEKNPEFKKELPENVLNGDTRLTLPTASGYELVDVSDIIRCRGEGNYTEFFTVNNKKYLVSQHLKKFEKKLTQNGFYRVHKSHLINISFVKGFTRGKGGFVMLSDGSKINISYRRKSEFIQFIQGARLSVLGRQ